MFDDARRFRRTDPDFPTTRAAQQRLIAAGRVEGEGPLARPIQSLTDAPGRPAAAAPKLAVPEGPCVPLGETDRGTLHLDLNGCSPDAA